MAKKTKEEDVPLLLHGNSYENQDLFYITGFLTTSTFTCLKKDGSMSILINSMERKRAEEESCATKVITPGELVDKESMNQMDAIKNFVEENTDSDKIRMPGYTPINVYKKLKEKYKVEIVGNVLDERAIKAKDEISKIKKSQKAAESALRKAREALKKSVVEGGGLVLEEKALTQGKLKRIIRTELIEMNCDCRGLIVSSGKESAYPHKTGRNGKQIREGAPIVVDVFPKNRKSRYNGDMTRTFVKGEPNKELVDMHRAVVEAQRKVLKVLKAGTKVSEVEKTVSDVFGSRGYHYYCTDSQENKDGGKNRASIRHAPGHGIGLEVHEPPCINSKNDVELKEGNVVALEPGLYKDSLGGVRVEDVVVIRKNGVEVLGSMSKKLIA